MRCSRVRTNVTMKTLLLLLDVRVDVLVVILVNCLPQQIQAVQLVEDLDSCAVSLLACGRVLDLQRVSWEAQPVKFFL